MAIDGFTKFVELFPRARIDAPAAVSAILEVAGRYGAPKAVRCDHGGQYVADVTQSLLELLGTKLCPSVAYHPQGNGTVERANQEVMRHLRAMMCALKERKRWSAYLPLVMRIINAQPHSTTGVAPLRLLFGDAVTPQRGLLRDFRNERHENVNEYVETLLATQRKLIDTSNGEARKMVESLAARHEKRRGGRDFTAYEPGDYVLVSYPSRPPTKLTPPWRGPMLVVERQDDSVYRCQDLTNQKIRSYHVERLKPYRVADGQDPVVVATMDDDEWQVSAIVDHKLPSSDAKTWEFRVHWAGFGDEDDSWQSYEDVRGCEALEAYLKAHPELGNKYRRLKP